MLTTLIYPRKNGHFKNYISIIESHHNKRTASQLVNKSKLSQALFSISKAGTSEKSNYIFLHAESHWFAAILLRLFGHTNKISLLFYYGLLNSPSTTRRLLVKALLEILNILDIEPLSLENPTEDLVKIDANNTKMIFDPILLSPPETIPPHRPSASKFLIAGYIDNRKSIVESINGIHNYSKAHNIKSHLTILGQQDKRTQRQIAQKSEPNSNPTIKSVNERFSDEQLHQELTKTDIVLAIYKNHAGSSSMVINAILHNKPVLFIAENTLQIFSKTLGISQLPKHPTEEEIARALNSLARSTKEQYTQTHRSSFLAKRTPEAFCRGLTGHQPPIKQEIY
ncbi:hypothetical protein [Pelagicoccus mobilis]|uniref:Glycosyl transferase family 1 domain-containing protein n=1 Tax=Pelagicoccus mobilis TaxID=415221 RepID=A0A934RXG6_9BACT|nr:hypothetical protein [Pelagicoccus mobilis]MBK1875679.1 hypothetical protein [Pelagicoccus mobilis]